MATLFGVSWSHNLDIQCGHLILIIKEELNKSVGQHKMEINAWSGEISVVTITYNKILPDISWLKLETFTFQFSVCH